MKKMLIFGAIIIAILVALGVLTSIQNNKKVENNVYKKDKLHPSTIKDLDDSTYQNIILPKELKAGLKNSDDLMVFFFSPECVHCKAAAPVIVPMAKEMGINLQLYNLLEFEEGWDEYGIESTPTFIHYKDGKEVDRFVGASENENDYREWLTKNKQ
ncbi:MAG: thioredoxin family protein [Bacillaceae bacterium]